MAKTWDLNQRVNVKQKTGADIPQLLGQPVIASHYAVSTASQTTISLPFTVDVANIDAFFLFVDGKKLTYGASNDFVMSGQDSAGLSSTVSLNQSLSSDLNIQAFKMGLKKEAELQTDSRFVTLYEANSKAFQAFVDQSLTLTATTDTGTPAAGKFHSTIVNRKPISDLTQDLGCRMGVERIPVQQIYQLQDEFGPNGERIWGDLNDAKNLIRFSGVWSVTPGFNGSPFYTGVPGSSVNFTSSSQFIEVTFYGTGLNMLGLSRGASTLVGDVYLDGVLYASSYNLNLATSTVLDGRGPSQNQVIPIIASQTLGTHTVRIQGNAGSTTGFVTYGFEVLNEASTINVRPGSVYNAGKKVTTLAAQSLSYSSSFDSIIKDGAATTVLGSKGARVSVYQKSDGTIGKAAIAVDTTQKNLTLTDHSNEEIVRTHYFREFGVGRADDFSSKVAGVNDSRAFTLEDGTTTLVASGINLIAADDTIYTNATVGTSFISITFVGTGLDIIRKDQSSGTAYTMTVSVDGGSSVGTLNTTASISERTEKVVSGLPYGTHTVRFLWTVNNTPIGFRGFVVYQPKKPSLPSGAIELADYNVMADFVANSTAGLETIATGILRKVASREFSYVNGSGGTADWLPNLDVSANIAGWSFGTDRPNAYFEYTFFGTGFDARHKSASDASSSVNVTINGLAATTTNFPTMSAAAYGTSSGFNSSTGSYDMSNSSNGGLRISGLPLGLYKVRLTNVSGSIYSGSLDIITPIHSPRSNLYADLQNTLPVGSCAISDNRKTSAIKEALPAQKAWVQAVAIVSSPTSTTTSYIPVPDMSVTITCKQGFLQVNYKIDTFNNTLGSGTFTQLYVDGLAVGKETYVATYGSASISVPNTDSIIVPVSAGTHKIDVYYKTNGGTTTISSDRRTIVVREL